MKDFIIIYRIINKTSITFSKETIESLNQNQYVVEVSEKSITYSDEFKRLFIEKYLKGKIPRVIFEETGFDVIALGVKRYEQVAARWIRTYNNGIIELRDIRKENYGSHTDKEITKDDIILKQEAKIELLEEQLELLKN